MKIHASFKNPRRPSFYDTKGRPHWILSGKRRKKKGGKKRLSGFGLTRDQHQNLSLSVGRAARAGLAQARRLAAAGQCEKAIRWLADAAYWTGEMRTHSRSRSLQINRRRKSGKGGSGGQAQTALWGTARRIAARCAK